MVFFFFGGCFCSVSCFAFVLTYIGLQWGLGWGGVWGPGLHWGGGGVFCFLVGWRAPSGFCRDASWFVLLCRVMPGRQAVSISLFLKA
jgi:hypothetical protein